MEKGRGQTVSMSSERQHIYSEQVRMLYGQLRLGALSSLISAAVLCLLLWPEQPATALLIWYALVIVVNLPRLYITARFNADKDFKSHIKRWVGWLLVSNFAGGAAWGIGAYWLFLFSTFEYQVFITVILAGLAAAATPLYSALRSAYAAFILPVMLPLAWSLYSTGGTLQFYMAWMVLVYVIILLGSSRRIHATLTESLELRFSNSRLLDTLTAARQQLQDSNNHLQAKLLELEIAEQSAQKSNAILNAITRAQMRFIQRPNLNELFDELLANLLRLTQSEYGFIGQVLHDAQAKPYLKTYSLTNIAWNEETRAFYAENAPTGMEFHNLDTLFGAIITSGQAVISNDPSHDPRAGGLPDGHPSLRSFLGLPFFHSGELIGVVGIANRSGGYNQSIVNDLAPFLHTCASIIHAERVAAGRLRAETNLERTAAELQAIHAQIADGIATLDFDGCFMTVNPAVERMFGLSQSELKGTPLERLLHTDEKDNWRIFLQNFIAGLQKPFNIQLRAMRVDSGTEFPLDIALSTLRLRNDERVIAVLRDVTERNRIERLKSEFIATVSHELRTPLTSIQGALALLHAGVPGELPEQARQLLTIALSNSERLGLLINDILDIEKIESGAIRFSLGPVAVTKLLEDAVRQNNAYAQRYQVHLRIDGELPEVEIYADRDRVMQVLSNLISNASKFSSAGGEVRLLARELGQSIRIEVIDSGCGIPEEFQDKVFEKFTQADASDARAAGGTGLGLSISKSLVERMQGSIGFHSQPGQGTTFFFELPLFIQTPKDAFPQYTQQ